MSGKKIIKWTEEEVLNRSNWVSDPTKRSVPKHCAICGKIINPKFVLCNPCTDEFGLSEDWIKTAIKQERAKYYRELKAVREIDFSDMGVYDESELEESDDYVYDDALVDDPWEDIDGAIDAEMALERLEKILTPREKDVLTLLLTGYNDEEVAVELKIPRQNVNFYHKNIQEKATRIGLRI